MSEIKTDQRNYRKHSEHNKNLINKSLKDLGAGRSILIDNQNEIIAGNGVFEESQQLNIPVRVIETDGTELIALKRIDLSTQDEKRKQLAVMDNSTGDTSEFDLELLKTDFEISELHDMGVPAFEVSNLELDKFFSDENNEFNKEPKKVTCPHCGKEFEL